MKKIIIGFIAFFLLSGQVHAISNEAIHWGFKKSKQGNPAEAGVEYDELLEKYGAFYKGSPNEKKLYLTFDNGYENGFTEKVLDTLKKEQVPATFFVTGHYLETAPEIAKRMVKEGHIIGNHSYTHPDLTTMSEEGIIKELDRVSKKTKELTGQEYMQYIRPPRGILSERTLAITEKAGYTHVLWSLAYKDWLVDEQKGKEYAYKSIMEQIHPGAVILLHTVSKDNAEVLEEVIQKLKKDGYQFLSLDDYIWNEKLILPF